MDQLDKNVVDLAGVSSNKNHDDQVSGSASVSERQQLKKKQEILIQDKKASYEASSEFDMISEEMSRQGSQSLGRLSQ